MKVYDTMAGEKREFRPASTVKMLICGPTMYDYSHVGHARTLLFYGLMARYLRLKGLSVTAVLNITDIDSKIFHRARAEGMNPYDLATRFINELSSDLQSFCLSDVFTLARVSDHVGTAQESVNRLLRGGLAYSGGGNVYLDTSRVPAFGRLSKMSRKELEDCRLDMSPGKKTPSDILLWNASEEFDVKFHDSMLGNGIPWWHMQDSSVAMANFNGIYDIHGGATELVYPHHECHLAQLKSLTSEKNPVKYWTHVGLVYSKGEKMSKSTGNVVVLRELLKRFSPNAIKLYLFSKHYRSEFEFSERELEKFKHVDEILMNAMSRLAKKGKKSKLLDKFISHIEDDFDTPRALKLITDAAKSGEHDLQTMVNIFGLRY